MRDEYRIAGAALASATVIYTFAMWADTALFPKSFHLFGLHIVVEPSCNAMELIMFLIGVAFALLAQRCIMEFRNSEEED
jgi:hypothetical protein